MFDSLNWWSQKVKKCFTMKYQFHALSLALSLSEQSRNHRLVEFDYLIVHSIRPDREQQRKKNQTVTGHLYLITDLNLCAKFTTWNIPVRVYCTSMHLNLIHIRKWIEGVIAILVNRDASRRRQRNWKQRSHPVLTLYCNGENLYIQTINRLTSWNLVPISVFEYPAFWNTTLN